MNKHSYSYDCWCEEFRDYNTAIGWLNEEFEVSDI